MNDWMSEELLRTYDVLERIGEGSGGVVYKAYHRRLQTMVVLKRIIDPEYSADRNLQEFNEIQATYPSKMVILGECGKDANTNTSSALPADFWRMGAKWGQFMVWYGANMEDDKWWKEALNCEDVITRDQVPSLQ